MKKLKGFTLIEIIVVISLIGIILGVGIVKLNFINNYSEKLEVNNVVNTLNFARSNSISTGENHSVRFQGKNIILYSNIENKEIKLEHIKLFNTETVTFTSTGAPKEACTLEFRGNKKYTITIGVATGKVSLSEK